MLGMILAVMAQAASVAYPQTAFGLTFGQSLAIPACEYASSGTSSQHMGPPVQSTCYLQPDAPMQGPEGEVQRYSILFAEGEQPRIVLQHLDAYTINGKLEMIEFRTVGVIATPAVMQDLQEKYGKPTKQTVLAMTNDFGASVSNTIADWSKGPIKVSYIGVLPGTRIGQVDIATAIGEKYRSRKTAEEAAQGQGTKL